MALRTRIQLWDTGGYEADRVRDDYVTEDYAQAFSQRHDVTGSPTRFEVDLGPVTTAQYLYINTDEDITVYRNRSITEGWTVSGALLIIGCSVTALHILATSDCEIFIYIAGD